MEVKVDEKDRKILEVLKEHADYATRQIAKKTGLPITTVHNRIQKLKKEKVIKRFTVDFYFHNRTNVPFLYKYFVFLRLFFIIFGINIKRSCSEIKLCAE